MKNSTFLKPGVLASLGLACAGVAGAFLIAGGTTPVAEPDTLSLLSRVPAPELPVVAARLVSQAAPEARSARAVEVVRAVNALASSSTLPFVVGSISGQSPDAAAAAVGEAAQLQPQASLAFVKTATAAAPSQSSAIVAQAVRQQPASYAQVALVAAQAAPTRSTEILGGLSSALPQIKPFVDRAVAGTAPSASYAQEVIASVHGMVQGAAQNEIASARAQSVVPGAAVTPAPSLYVPLVSSTQKGPPVVTPLTPPANPTTEHTIGDSTPQSGNDRDYSAP